MATFPNLMPAAVEVQRVAAQAVHIDPFAQGLAAYDHDGRAFRILVRMQELDRTDAALMLAFFEELDGFADTFDFDLDPWWHGSTPAPGVRTFRLLDPMDDWQTHLRLITSTGFAALEDL